MGNEEGHDASRPELDHGRFVAIEKQGGTGAEEQDEQRRAEHPDDVARGVGDVPREIDQQREKQRRDRVDDFWLPNVSSGLGQHGQRGQHGQEYDKIGELQFHALWFCLQMYGIKSISMPFVSLNPPFAFLPMHIFDRKQRLFCCQNVRHPPFGMLLVSVGVENKNRITY